MLRVIYISSGGFLCCIIWEAYYIYVMCICLVLHIYYEIIRIGYVNVSKQMSITSHRDKNNTTRTEQNNNHSPQSTL